MSILSIIAELESNDSRLKKESILTREKNNQLLKKFFKAALNPYVKYYQKKIPPFNKNHTEDQGLEWAIDALDQLSNRTYTGNRGIEYLTALFESINEEDAELLARVIERDPKCGVMTKTVNKVWTGLIPTFDVMLAHKDTSGIKYPAYAQTKFDGARCHLFFNGQTAQAFARSGKEFQLHGALDAAAKKHMTANETWDGEILFTDASGKILDRKTSNGIANKAIKGTITVEEASRAVFVAWDIVDFTSSIIYENRINTLMNRSLSCTEGKIRFAGVELVLNEEAAMNFYQRQIDDGQEGAIIKNIRSKWEPKRSKHLGKIKAEEEADLKVVGFNWGTGKFEGKLGSLICQTEDGLLEVSVSGMNEYIRFGFENLSDWIGNIVTVKYNEIIKDKNSGKYSLFLPRFVETRFDKREANTFAELK
jgi:ATP-dependent DNA ligase